MSASQRVSRDFHRLSAVVVLVVPTLFLAQDKSAVLENCKLKAIELYRASGEYIRASEYVVTCMIAAGYRIDPTKDLPAMDRRPLPSASSLGDVTLIVGFSGSRTHEVRRVATILPSYRRCCHANRCRAAESIPGLPSVALLSFAGAEAFWGVRGVDADFGFSPKRASMRNISALRQMLPGAAAAPYGRLRTFRRPPQSVRVVQASGPLYAKMTRDD